MMLDKHRQILIDDYVVIDRRLATHPTLKLVPDTHSPLGFSIRRTVSRERLSSSCNRKRGRDEYNSLRSLLVMLQYGQGLEFLTRGKLLDEFQMPLVIQSLPDVQRFAEALGFSEHVPLGEYRLPSSPHSVWGLIYDWLRTFDLVCSANSALVRAVDFSPELLRFLQEDPTRLRSLTPDQFERFVAERMDRMGFNVTLTGASNRKDGGIDLIAVPKLANVGSVVIAGQMKHHQGEEKTGRGAVDRLLAWKDSYFGVGLLVTNTTFTHDAVSTAQKERNARFLHLRDFTDLKRWLEGRFGEEADWREIPERIELAPGIVIDIPRPWITSVFPDRTVLRDIAPGEDFGGKSKE